MEEAYRSAAIGIIFMFFICYLLLRDLLLSEGFFLLDLKKKLQTGFCPLARISPEIAK